MPIPDLDEDGFLPGGVHDCSIDEIGEAFGRFRRTSQRPTSFGNLMSFYEELRQSGLIQALIVNGSFVTAKEEPNDIDLLVVLRAKHDFSAQLSPTGYNLLSRRRVQRRYHFDVLVARSGSAEYDEYCGFFQQVRGNPERQEGILKVRV